MRPPIAQSRRDYVPPAILEHMGTICRAIAWFEAEHCPKKGITTREIVEKYGLGETWYEYEDSPRRVNLAGQLIRNELNEAFKKRKLAKLYSVRTGSLVRRGGSIVYVPVDKHPDRQFVVGDVLPDKRKWLKDHDR